MTTTTIQSDPAIPSTGTVKPFGMKDKLGYMFGDLGNDMSFALASTFLMVFYTNVLGVNAVIVGTILLSVRLIDAFVDVGIGVAVDRMKPHKDGKFRPWIKWMMVPVAVSSFLLYIPNLGQFSEPMKLGYIFLTYLLWSCCYSGVNIPYGSMAASLSPDPADRASLSVFRTLGGQSGNMAISLMVPFFIYYTTEGGTQGVNGFNFMITAAVLSGLSIIWYILCYVMVTERVAPKPAPKDAKNSHGIGTMLKGLAQNKALASLIAAALCLLMAFMLSGALSSYLWLTHFQNGAMQGIAQTLSILPILLLLPAATPLAKRFGKKEVSAVGMLFAAAVFLVLYFLKLQDGTAYIVGILVAGLGLAFFNTLVWAFIGDIIDYQEVKTHVREDGTIYAIYSMARKMGQALAGGLGGWALGWVGYNSLLAQQNQPQSQETTDGIYMLSTLVPGVMYGVVALVLLLWYPLSKRAVEENTAILAERNAQSTAHAIAESTEAGTPATQIITMWELYGSGMDEIAARVARELDLPLHKQAFTSEEIEASESEREKESAFMRLLLGSGPVAVSASGTSTNVAQRAKAIGDVARDNREIVTEEARVGGIILGRNGAFLLNDIPGSLHVKLVGPVEARVTRGAELAGISRERSARRQVAEDFTRREMSLQAYKFDPTGNEYYDLVIDTTRFSVDETVDMIKRAAATRQG